MGAGTVRTIRKSIATVALGLLVALAVTALNGTPVLAAGPGDPAGQTSMLVVLPSGQPLQAAIRAFEAQGARAGHIFPPDAFIVAAPTGTVLNHAGASLYSGPVEMAHTATWTPSARQAAAVWNALRAAPESLDALPAEHAEARADAFEAPPSELPAVVSTLAETPAPLPNFDETSQFFFGSVAVGLVLPESDGAVDPSTEDWTEAERNQVAAEVAAALEWWRATEPAANLSFVYHNLAADTTPTQVEPITRPYSDQKYWIKETMTALGFGGSNYFDQVRSYNNFLRDTYQTDWAFTIFVVDSSADSDNRFSDGHFAYAYLGGPFLVLTYGNNGYGPQNMDAVAAHEVGHIFRALDQYPAAGQGCTATSGYLGTENQNSQFGCASDEPSIMRGQIAPFINGQIDPYARGQLGWQDSDGNGILDPVDVGLKVGGVVSATAGAPNVISFTGQLAEVPFASPGYRDILINKILTVEIRVDDGPWLAAAPLDGLFDSYQETFTATTNPLTGGSHNIFVRAIDNYGKENQALLAVIETVGPAGNQVDTQFNDSNVQSKVVGAGEEETFTGVAVQGGGGTIAGVEFRIDGGPWQAAQAADGAFNSETEDFNLTVNTAGLASGQHTIEARAVDNLGYVDDTPATVTLTVQAQLNATTVFLPFVVSS